MRAVGSPIRSPISSPIRSALDVSYRDLVETLGGVYLLRSRDRYVRPGLAFGRAQQVFEPQSDGSLAAYTGAQVPWGAQGVRLDPGWVNFTLWSSSLTNAAWGKTRCSAVNVSFAHPLGGSVVSKIIEDTSVSLSHLAQSSVTTSVTGSSYTARAILYPDERKHAALCFTGGGGGTDRGVFVDLLTGAITGAFGSYPASYGASLRADGGVDVFITEAAPGAAGYAARVYLCSAQNVSVYTGDGASGLRVAVLNLTNTAYPVPLTRAEGSAVTVPNFSFSGLLADMGITLGSEYTIGVDYTLQNLAANYQPISVSISGGNSFNESIYQNAATLSAGREPNWAVIDGGVGQGNSMGLGPATVVGQVRKTVLRAKPNDFRAAFNGVLSLPDTSGTLPDVDRIYIGLNWQGLANNAFQGSISNLWIVPTLGLPDAQLQALSTI